VNSSPFDKPVTRELCAIKKERALRYTVVNASHREKVLLARVIRRDELDAYVKVLEEEFNLKLVRFSPAISAKTKARRKR